MFISIYNVHKYVVFFSYWIADATHHDSTGVSLDDSLISGLSTDWEDGFKISSTPCRSSFKPRSLFGKLKVH